jgi:HSP20 family protein
MAANQSSQRSGTQTQQTQQGQQGQQGQQQGRSLSRRPEYLPSFSGDLFSMSPFALLREMTDWMDRSWATSGSRSGGGQGGHGGGTALWNPAVEVRQKDNNLIVCADLPGIDQNDVRLAIENDALVIEGERKREHEEDREGWHRTERSYGRFYRAIPLPEGAQAENAKAEFRNGVLEVTIPVEEAKSNRRQIPIQSGGASKISSGAGGSGSSSTGSTSTSSTGGSTSGSTGATSGSSSGAKTESTTGTHQKS